MIYDTWDESNVVHVGYGESVLPITKLLAIKQHVNSVHVTLLTMYYPKNISNYNQVDMSFKSALQLYDKPLFDR